MRCYLIATLGISHGDDRGGTRVCFGFRRPDQKRSDTRYHSSVMQIHRSGVLQQAASGRRRAVPIIVPALLGVAILTEATQVCGRVRTESSPSMPWNQAAPAPWTGSAPVPLRYDDAMRVGRMGNSGAAQMTPPVPNRSPPGRMLVLTGIIAYTDPKQGFAIIGSSARDTYLARPGQQLPDGSLVREIHPRYVLLEHGGSLETVGMYDGGHAAGAVYAQMPPLPQPTRWEDTQLRGATSAQMMTPSQPPPTDAPPDHAPRGGLRINEIPVHVVRSTDAPPSETPPSDAPPSEASANDALPKQVQPEAPLPATQDPADEFSDDRRQRAENRRK